MGIKRVTLGKACRIKVAERNPFRPANFIRERAYPAMDETRTTRTVMPAATRKVLKVINQIVGDMGPKGGFHRKLQLRRVHPSDLRPSVLVEKLVINNHRKPRRIRALGTIKRR